MNVCPFWYDGGLIGGVFGLLPGIGAFFVVGCVNPPFPLYLLGCFGLGFSRNCLGFVLESVAGGGIFMFLFVDGVVFTGGCMTPPQ